MVPSLGGSGGGVGVGSIPFPLIFSLSPFLPPSVSPASCISPQVNVLLPKDHNNNNEPKAIHFDSCKPVPCAQLGLQLKEI